MQLPGKDGFLGESQCFGGVPRGHCKRQDSSSLLQEVGGGNSSSLPPHATTKPGRTCKDKPGLALMGERLLAHLVNTSVGTPADSVTFLTLVHIAPLAREARLTLMRGGVAEGLGALAQGLALAVLVGALLLWGGQRAVREPALAASIRNSTSAAQGSKTFFNASRRTELCKFVFGSNTLLTERWPYKTTLLLKQINALALTAYCSTQHRHRHCHFTLAKQPCDAAASGLLS